LNFMEAIKGNKVFVVQRTESLGWLNERVFSLTHRLVHYKGILMGTMEASDQKERMWVFLSPGSSSPPFLTPKYLCEEKKKTHRCEQSLVLSFHISHNSIWNPHHCC
jgi:hypothetical protein